MAKLVLTILMLYAGFAVMPLEAGFRSPESLVRNVYAYYGDRSSDLSSGLPHDPDTVRQFFDPSLREAWIASRKPPMTFWSRARPGSSALSRYQSCASNSTRPMSSPPSTIRAAPSR
jgi:hypothetical protein